MTKRSRSIQMKNFSARYTNARISPGVGVAVGVFLLAPVVLLGLGAAALSPPPAKPLFNF